MGRELSSEKFSLLEACCLKLGPVELYVISFEMCCGCQPEVCPCVASTRDRASRDVLFRLRGQPRHVPRHVLLPVVVRSCVSSDVGAWGRRRSRCQTRRWNRPRSQRIRVPGGISVGVASESSPELESSPESPLESVLDCCRCQESPASESCQRPESAESSALESSPVLRVVRSSVGLAFDFRQRPEPSPESVLEVTGISTGIIGRSCRCRSWCRGVVVAASLVRGTGHIAPVISVSDHVQTRRGHLRNHQYCRSRPNRPSLSRGVGAVGDQQSQARSRNPASAGFAFDARHPVRSRWDRVGSPGNVSTDRESVFRGSVYERYREGAWAPVLGRSISPHENRPCSCDVVAGRNPGARNGLVWRGAAEPCHISCGEARFGFEVVAVRFRDSHAHSIASAQSLRLVGTLISG